MQLSQKEQQNRIKQLLMRAENALCADCNSKFPSWASLSFGVFVCYNCSGCHRALGPCVTRVKSIDLDQWKEQWLHYMRLGNSVLNQHWERHLPLQQKPNSQTCQKDLTAFVRDKYVNKRYMNPHDKINPLEKIANLKSNTPQSQITTKAYTNIATNKKTQTKTANIPQSNAAFKTQMKIKKNNHFEATEMKKISSNPFDSFDTLFAKTQKTLKDNNPTAKSQFIQKGKSVNCINMNQFQSMGGIPLKSTSISNPKIQNNIFSSFDTVFQFKPALNHNDKQNAKQNIQHQDLLDINPIQNPIVTDLKTNQSESSKKATDPTEKNQYITMNINMNIYPTVMNFNLSIQQSHSLHKGYQNINKEHNSFNNGILPSNIAQNQYSHLQNKNNQVSAFATMAPRINPKTTEQNQHKKGQINMQSNIDLSRQKDNKSKMAHTLSWIDDWK